MPERTREAAPAKNGKTRRPTGGAKQRRKERYGSAVTNANSPRRLTELSAKLQATERFTAAARWLALAEAFCGPHSNYAAATLWTAGPSEVTVDGLGGQSAFRGEPRRTGHARSRIDDKWH